MYIYETNIYIYIYINVKIPVSQIRKYHSQIRRFSRVGILLYVRECLTSKLSYRI